MTQEKVPQRLRINPSFHLPKLRRGVNKRPTNGAFGNQAKSKFWSYFKKKQKSA